MTKKATVSEIYDQYKKQIDAIINLSEGKSRKAAKIIEFFYGGSHETWRKFISKLGIQKEMPKEVSELFEKLKE